MLNLLHRASAIEPAIPLIAAGDPAWLWTRADLELRRDEVLLEVAAGLRAEIAAGMDFIRGNGLTLDSVEQEDFRCPSFARMVPSLRRRLDDGPGVVILRGLDLDRYTDDEAGIIAWCLANYLGRPLRQGLSVDRRVWSVTDRGDEARDPVRLGATNRESYLHTDNGCLEPRPPCYIGLLCVRNGIEGGASTVASAATLHNVLLEENPELLRLLYRPYHFLPPRLHAWPKGPPTVVKPIFERVDGRIVVHYARVMIEPGMQLAGTPLDERQRAALDALDAVMGRKELHFEYRMERGDFLITNNLQTAHGRTGYLDNAATGQRRLLKRVWMWRRHVGPGVDPVALDAADFGITA